MVDNVEVEKRTFFQVDQVSDLKDVLMVLGRVQEGVERLRQDFSEEKKTAASSRKAIYERHEEMRDDLVSLKSDIDMAAVISTQKMAELTQKLDDHKNAIQPSIEDWIRIKNLGLGISGILAIGGLSVGALLTAGMDTFRAAMRHWFG